MQDPVQAVCICISQTGRESSQGRARGIFPPSTCSSRPALFNGRPQLHATLQQQLPDGALSEMLQHLDLVSLRSLQSVCHSLRSLVDQHALRKLQLTYIYYLPPLTPSPSSTRAWAAIGQRSYQHVTQLSIFDHRSMDDLEKDNNIMRYTAFMIRAAPTLSCLSELCIHSSTSGTAVLLAASMMSGHAPPLSTLSSLHINSDRLKFEGYEGEVHTEQMAMSMLYPVFNITSLRSLHLIGIPLNISTPISRLSLLTSLTADIAPASQLASVCDVGGYSHLSHLTALTQLSLKAFGAVHGFYGDTDSSETWSISAEHFGQLTQALPVSLLQLIVLNTYNPGDYIGISLAAMQHLSRLQQLSSLIAETHSLTLSVLTGMTALHEVRLRHIDTSDMAVGIVTEDEHHLSALQHLKALHLYDFTALPCGLPQLFPALTELQIKRAAPADLAAGAFHGGVCPLMHFSVLPLPLVQLPFGQACRNLCKLKVQCYSEDVDYVLGMTRHLGEALSCLQSLHSPSVKVPALQPDGDKCGDALIAVISGHCQTLRCVQLVFRSTVSSLCSLLVCPYIQHVALGHNPACTSSVVTLLLAKPSIKQVVLYDCSCTAAMVAEAVHGCNRQGVHAEVCDEEWLYEESCAAWF